MKLRPLFATLALSTAALTTTHAAIPNIITTKQPNATPLSWRQVVALHNPTLLGARATGHQIVPVSGNPGHYKALPIAPANVTSPFLAP